AQWRDTHFHFKGVVTEPGRGEEVASDWYQPVTPDGRAVGGGEDGGVAGLRKGNAPRPEVQKLIEAGVAVIGVNLHLQGGEPVKETRLVAGPREVPAYTFGYNSSLFAQRVHDVLTVVRMLKTDRSPDHPEVKTVDLMGIGRAGVVASAARAVLGDSVRRTAVYTAGFRFSQLLSYRDPMFLPGGSKYLDVPGLLALCPPDRLWIAGESSLPEFVSADAVRFDGPAESRASAAVEWLLK
ncbi:MAG: acetylxylan esterase, partial [Opitutia bacterium]